MDTTIFVAAFRSHLGASRKLLQLVPTRAFLPVVSPALYLEYESVLNRPEQPVVHGISPQRIEQALLYFAGFTEKVRIHFSYRPQLRDENDEMVLEAAINGCADAIVNHNVRDFLPAAHRFGIEVLTPGRILKERLNR